MKYGYVIHNLDETEYNSLLNKNYSKIDMEQEKYGFIQPEGWWGPLTTAKIYKTENGAIRKANQLNKRLYNTENTEILSINLSLS